VAGDLARPPPPAERGSRAGTAGAPRGGPRPGPGPVLEQAFDRSSLDALRAAVAAHALLAGVTRAQADDLVLVTHELAANAVLHGAGHGRLRAWRHGQAMHCEVTDDGPRRAVSAAGPQATAGASGRPDGGPTPPDGAWWPAERGHGLWVVSQLTDRASLCHDPDGTTAAARLPLAP
jgi:anti-sigma regulatory factor (Ser/Thr protein kinase)